MTLLPPSLRPSRRPPAARAPSSALLARAIVAPALLAAPLAFFLGGCGGGPALIAEGFDAPPAAWTTFAGAPAAPAAGDGRLELEGDAAFLDARALPRPAAAADVALLDGDARGHACLFLVRGEGEKRDVFAVALRLDGSVRAFRSSSPLDPVGGEGWKRNGEGPGAGLRRLAIEAGDSAVTFRIDGVVIERRPLEALPGGGGAPALPWRVGLAQRGVTARWRRLAAIEGTAAALDPERLDPERLVPWGGAAEARRALEEAEAEARALARKPGDPGALRRLGAGLDAALRAARASGDAALEAEVAAAGGDLATRTRAAAGRSGAALHRGIAALLEGEGERDGAASPSRAIPEAAAQRIEALRARLEPLRLTIRLPESPDRRLVDPVELGAVVRSSYGGLERAESGELAIEVRVDRARVDTEAHDAERTVTVRARSSAGAAALESELEDLKRRLPEQLLDARGRATLLRGSAEAIGPGALRDLETFPLGGETLELHVDDGKALAAAEARIADLERRLARLDGGAPARRKVPAKLHSTSVLLELTYTLTLDGETVVDARRERTYLGIEQWSHPALENLGIPASTVDDARTREAIASVRRRALGRFRDAISIEGLFARLDPSRRLEVAARLGRATRLEGDVSRLAWLLRKELSLDGEALDAAARRLLEAP